MELKFKETSGIDEKEVKGVAKKIEPYTFHLGKIAKEGGYNSFESSINLPFDSEMQTKIRDLAERKNNKKLKYILVIGIGGSNLGALAVYEAIYGKLDVFLKNRFPKIIFIETISTKSLKTMEELLNEISNPNEILINVISKSGTTFETLTNFDALYNFLKNRFNDIEERIVFTTDYQSKLWQKGEGQGIGLLEIPKNVVGRYSAFSSVGIFPLMLAGINIDSLIEGARFMRNLCLKPNIDSNPALLSAILLYLYNQKGIHIYNTFFSNPELEELGRWYRQLLAESIGKDSQGITPLISMPADLHSMLQLYLDGPKDKFTAFVYTPPMKLILEEVINTYQKKKLPFLEITLPEISEFSLGEYMQFRMMEMMFLAKLLNVNPFDQPAVEAYKKEAKRV